MSSANWAEVPGGKGVSSMVSELETHLQRGRPWFDPRLGRAPGGGHRHPLQCYCLENPHGQRNLTGYSLWGYKELDTTEQLSTAQPLFLHSTTFIPKECPFWALN